MGLRFFSDPHIGTVRTSHTTVPSRQALTRTLHQQALLASDYQDGPVFCLGDLFDTDSNSEASILQGADVVMRCTAVLGGNHDLPNREGKLSSLQLLDSVVPGKIVCGSTDEPGFMFHQTQEAVVYMVPHMATQDLFDLSLTEAAAHADSLTGEPKILCLHCNYNSGLIHNDASLNLTKEKADALLSSFSYILLGHEHASRVLHGGGLIILGNTHPTSFSDISDKFVWDFRDGVFTSQTVWSKKAGYRELDWEVGADSIPETVQFIEVSGNAPAERLPDIAQWISTLWKNYPNLLMVRNRVESSSITPEVDVSMPRSLDLPARISTALASSDLLPLWEQYKEAVQ